MSMSHSDNKAQQKGAADQRRSMKQGPVDSIFSPTYRPTSGKKEQYDAGWSNAKKQDQQNRKKKP